MITKDKITIEKSGNKTMKREFIKLCLNSELSSIITLQPINRFDLDSAIIFSDILLVPHALGQHVNFTKNNGPKLSELNINSFMEVNKKEFSKKLSPVYKAIEITRKKLNTSMKTNAINQNQLRSAQYHPLILCSKIGI